MVSKFLKRLLPVSALALAASAALDAGGAQAILVFEFLEQGSDVRLDVSGSLTGLPASPYLSSACYGDSVRPNAIRILACVDGRYYPVTNGPSAIGTSTNYSTLVGYVGTPLFMADDELVLESYNEGDPITGSGLLTGQSFSSLGLNSTTPGALLGRWDIGTDKIEARIAVPGPLPLFGLAAAFAHSRRLRARLRVGSAPQA
jgi:hypothetical protein